MTESTPQPEELAERRRWLEEQLAKRRRELEEQLEQQVAEGRRKLEEALELAELKARQSKEPLSPCPECGEQRVMFYCDPGSGYSLGIPVSGNNMNTGIPLYACACLNCGHTTLRIRPKDMEKLRKEAENERRAGPSEF
jgi:hypothetical protein